MEHHRLYFTIRNTPSATIMVSSMQMQRRAIGLFSCYNAYSQEWRYFSEMLVGALDILAGLVNVVVDAIEDRTLGYHQVAQLLVDLVQPMDGLYQLQNLLVASIEVEVQLLLFQHLLLIVFSQPLISSQLEECHLGCTL